MSTFEVSVTPSDLKRTQEVSRVRAKSSGQRGQGVLFACLVLSVVAGVSCVSSLGCSVNIELLTFAMPLAPAAAPPPVSGISPPPPLTTETNVTENWKIFRQKWENYSVITNLTSQALLLHTLGDDGLRMYNGFQFDTPKEDRTAAEIIASFEAFAVGEVNITYERYVFNKRFQQEAETFECFLASIRRLVKTCQYCENCVNSIIRDRIVLGIRDPETQSELLKERTLTLRTCVDICRAAENANSQAGSLRHESVNKVTTRKKDTTPRRYQQPSRPPRRFVPREPHKPSGGERDCKLCSYQHRMRKEECPAYGKTCNNCQEKNHFSSKCPRRSGGRRVHMVTDKPYDEEWIYSVDTAEQGEKHVKCRMDLAGEEITFQIDTGSTVNMLPHKYANNLSPSARQLKMWNNSELLSKGECRQTIRNPRNGKKYSVNFVIYDGDFMPLLGYSASKQMELITVNDKNFYRIATVSLENKYSDLFDGQLGQQGTPHHLKVNENMHPVVMPSRRIPIAVRPKLKAELSKMQKLGVITPVDEPTQWVSQLVMTLNKSGALRVCVDPRELNKALLREHYTLPILDETLHEIRDSRVFSLADLSSGYWHISLDKESSLLTTFQTPFGRYRWCRLPFGTSVSAEIFQKKLLDSIEGLPGVTCIADDVLIHGKDVEDQYHDRCLELFLKCCQETGIKLNYSCVLTRSCSWDILSQKMVSNLTLTRSRPLRT